MMAGLDASNKLLTEKKFPKEHEERIVNNFRHYGNWLEQQEAARKQMQIETQKREIDEKLKRAELRKEKEAKAKINKRRGKKVKVR
jgi:hypothetical protein